MIHRLFWWHFAVFHGVFLYVPLYWGGLSAVSSPAKVKPSLHLEYSQCSKEGRRKRMYGIVNRKALIQIFYWYIIKIVQFLKRNETNTNRRILFATKQPIKSITHCEKKCLIPVNRSDNFILKDLPLVFHKCFIEKISITKIKMAGYLFVEIISIQLNKPTGKRS